VHGYEHIIVGEPWKPYQASNTDNTALSAAAPLPKRWLRSEADRDGIDGGRGTRPFHPDDLVVWPEGTCAAFEECGNGEFSWRCNDVEIVHLDGIQRLRELGLTEFIGQ
jgi:hypothetical protein